MRIDIFISHLDYTSVGVHLFEVIALGLVLSADSFSAALAMGFRPFSRQQAFRFAIISSSIEGFVTWVGAWSGAEIVRRFSSYDHWVAFGLLASVAIHMIFESIQEMRSPVANVNSKSQLSHGLVKILIVSMATSLDGLVVGIGLGVIGKPIFPYLISVVVWAFGGTLLGLALARKLSERFGAKVNLLCAVILLVLAVKLLEI